MLALLVFFGRPLVLKVTHHVRLDNTLLVCGNARQDGSMVGSKGYMGPHEGKSEPLIVLKGRQISIRDKTKLNYPEVIDFGRGGSVLVREDIGRVSFPAKVVKGELRITGSGTPYKPRVGQKYTESMPDSKIRKIFPVPDGFSDTAGIRKVYWTHLRNGYDVGQVEFSWNMDSSWRAAIRTPNKQIQPLENYVAALKGFKVRGVHHIGKSWMLISADKLDRPGNITLGFGDHLFWIEIR